MKKNLTVLFGVLTIAAVFALSGCGGGTAPSDGGAGSAYATGQASGSGQAESQKASNPAGLEDGVYRVDVKTDSNMFHLNEAKNGEGELTVKDGKMVLHITMPSKNIVNLYLGTEKEAEAAAESDLIQPTTDEVTYSDGITEEVYGFDIPLEALGDTTVAIIGTHGNWYTHTITVGNPILAD